MSDEQLSEKFFLALDYDRELAAEIGLLLSCYTLIELFVVHIYSVVCGTSKDEASNRLNKVRKGERIKKLKELIRNSQREEKSFEQELIENIEEATRLRNEYAHAIYSQVTASETGWRMTIWQSDGDKRRILLKDISLTSVRSDTDYIRKILKSLFHFGGIEVVYE